MEIVAIVDQREERGSRRVQIERKIRKDRSVEVKIGTLNVGRGAGMICDRKVSARMKGNVHSKVVRPAILNGLGTSPLTKRLKAKLKVAELKMLRFVLGGTRMERIRNKYIRGKVQVGC